MGQVYRFLGLTIGIPFTDDPKEELTSEEKKEFMHQTSSIQLIAI